jgi:hypothetical protein
VERSGLRFGTALFVSALGSKTESWMRMRRIGRMQEQKQLQTAIAN